jgi:uncharacterized membrane protein
MQYNETHLRTISKALTWRVLLTASHILNGWFVTGSWATGLKLAGAALIVNSILYWMHERIWNRALWNRRDDLALRFQEGNPRSLSKMITWRVTMIFSLTFIGYVTTGDWAMSATFMSIAVIGNMAIYWLHERAWNRMRWGKQHQDQIVGVAA